MSASLEREVKLRFDSPAAARAAVLAAGAVPLAARRLQSDLVVDTDAAQLRNSRCALRVRPEPSRAFLTFKGPPQPSVMKLREELETGVDNGVLLLAILERLGYRVWFRYEKYREEFSLDGVVIAVDETPIGTFVEIEGTDAGIADAAARLGRTSDDFIVDSYRGLFAQECSRRGVEPGNMLFDQTS
jgi:adenylate cyclase class 2